MKRTENKTGSYCFKGGYICDQQMIDSQYKIDRCSGFCKKCNNGSSWEWYEKETKFLHRTPETIGLQPMAFTQIDLRSTSDSLKR